MPRPPSPHRPRAGRRAWRRGRAPAFSSTALAVGAPSPPGSVRRLFDRFSVFSSFVGRLAALHAFFRYAAFAEPAHALQCQQVLAIPGKRYERGAVEFLSQEEAAAPLPRQITHDGSEEETTLSAPRRPPHRSCMPILPAPHRTDSDAPHPPTFGRHGPSSSRCGPHRHRTLARSRVDGNNPGRHSRRHGVEGEGTLACIPVGPSSASLPCDRRPAGLPRVALNHADSPRPEMPDTNGIYAATCPGAA